MKLKELDHSEATLIHALSQHPGWKVLSKELKEVAKLKYKQLRKSTRDSSFYKIQGYLDSIDDLFRFVEQKIYDLTEEIENYG